MSAAEATQARERCSIHTDRGAVARCASCGRPACVACAIPFRGTVLCTACAARELGAPEPEEATTPVLPRRPALVAGGLLALALLASIGPWHRSGSLTSVLSAWSPARGWSPLLACVSLLGATVLTWSALLLAPQPARRAATVASALAASAAVAAALTLVRAPDYFSPTVVPFVVMAAAAAAAGLGFARLSPRS